jgi:hypothetical protein
MRRILVAAQFASLFVAGAASADVAEGVKGLTPAEVVSVMASRRIPIRKKCYEESPEKAPTSVMIDFTIAPTGVVTDVATHEVKGVDSIVQCVAAEVRRTVFPASEGGGRFRWPFIFKGP